MRRIYLGAAIGLCIFVAALATSYFVLNHVYGTKQIITSIQTMTIEDSGKLIITENAEFSVENVEPADANYYRLLVSSESFLSSEEVPKDLAPAPATGESRLQEAPGQFYYLTVPAKDYDRAVQTGTPVTVSNITVTETKPIDVLPIATSIGIAMGLVAFAIWVGYRQAWGDATSTLLEHGLHDMTVRDIEIVGYIMQRRDFTIPELMKLTKASKITVWRTVQKLVESGLVEQTGETKLAANGLGGRGKPSQIYRYVGEKGRKVESRPT